MACGITPCEAHPTSNIPMFAGEPSRALTQNVFVFSNGHASNVYYCIMYNVKKLQSVTMLLLQFENSPM